ncbi:MAG TPA: hypothetical protein VGD45_16630 [Steroidobacter sp.]|uniref:hypothetical protein n=1 Tax=Steroidobacter sp. TaxID=1978227 RepID=UPI002EDAFABB
MLQRFSDDVVFPLRHVGASSQFASRLRCLPAITIWWLTLGVTCKVHAQPPVAEDDNASSAAAPAACLPDGRGYLKARLSGAVQAELVWGNDGMECTGAVRPDGGLRIRFSHPDGSEGGRLVLLFGVAGLREGQSAKTLPVNVTVIREGQGEFYSTQGDNKCTLDEVAQQPITGIPHRSRSYRISARGFCTGPARAVNGKGAVMLSRFDYVGRVDFDEQDTEQPEDKMMAVNQP